MNENGERFAELKFAWQCDVELVFCCFIFQKVDIAFYPWIFHGEYLP
jgi:hypothetical protein